MGAVAWNQTLLTKLACLSLGLELFELSFAET